MNYLNDSISCLLFSVLGSFLRPLFIILDRVSALTLMFMYDVMWTSSNSYYIVCLLIKPGFWQLQYTKLCTLILFCFIIRMEMRHVKKNGWFVIWKDALLKALEWKTGSKYVWIRTDLLKRPNLWILTKKFLIWLNNVEDILLVLTFNTSVCRKIQKLIIHNSGIVSIAYKKNYSKQDIRLCEGSPTTSLLILIYKIIVHHSSRRRCVKFLYIKEKLLVIIYL